MQRSLLLTVLPCLVLTVAPKDMSSKVLPALKDTQALAEDLMRYVLAGLDAVAKGAGPTPAAPAAPATRPAVPAKAGRRR
ncbi:hypothetical protein [Variovorax sp. E3]|uniref:hypothetical protein n=1 Tax=Variovorax sp. E3 TaxID=1914993 RepID=UPI0022B6407D|nr:hypothetical protein [Variovorax sp. E3]